jgi:hypothetical protein
LIWLKSCFLIAIDWERFLITLLAEPIFRDADVVSLDLKSKSDSVILFRLRLMVLTEREICSLSRYGISDKVSIFGIFNHNNSSQESVLIAQIIWYFIEGFHYRSNEYPFESRKLYKIYRAYGRRNAYFL